jgi:hypothetical protein
MKVSIDSKGTLTVKAEGELESYALNQWQSWYSGPANTSPSTLGIEISELQSTIPTPIRASLDHGGCLTLTALSGTESYALAVWHSDYKHNGKAHLVIDLNLTPPDAPGVETLP